MAYLIPKRISTFIIKKQVVRVEKLVGERNKFKSIAFKQKTKLIEKNNREEREKNLEEPKDTREKLVSSKISTPKLGFLGIIKNFLFSILFGTLALKLLPHLPKLKSVAISAFKAGNFILEFSGMLLNSLVTFVDKVYQIIDFGKQQAKLFGGDTGVANYEKMLDTANKVMNSMFIAGMLFSELVELNSGASAKQEVVNKIQESVTEQIVKRQGFRTALQAVGQRIAAVARVGGPVMLAGLASSILGELMFQQRKYTSQLEKDTYKKLEEAQKDPNLFTRAAKLTFYNAFAIPGLRFYNFISTGVGTLLDIIGAPFRYLSELINFAIMSVSGDSKGIAKQRENLGKLDARIREQIRQVVNTLSFGMLAKEKGSFGSLYGNESVKAMGYASGGPITRGGREVGGEIGRTVTKKVITRTIEIPVSPLLPGADVGGQMPYINPSTNKQTGKSKIETFFPNLEGSETVNPYQYLKKSYVVASSGEFLKSLVQMPIKMIMGDSPSEGDYNALAYAINNLFNTVLGRTSVSEGRTLSDEIGAADIVKWARDSIKKSLTEPINKLLKNLMNQFKLKTPNGSAGPSPSAQKGRQVQDNPLAQFGGEAQFVIGDSIARGFAGLGSTPGTDADDTKNGRSPASVLEVLKRKGDSLRGMLIDLSTGIANSPQDFATVEEQLSYLKSIGARVRVLGVGNAYSKENGNINERLSQLVQKYGFYFYGGYKGGADKVHATPEDYSELKMKRERETASTFTQDSADLSNLGSGKGKQIYLHWTAGGYQSVPSGAYHTIITGDGKIHRVIPYNQRGQHTEGRNSNSVGLSVAAMGGSPDPWSIPVKSIQYEKMAEEVARIAKAWGWTASDINIKNVMTHAEAGSNKDGRNATDNYGPRSWGGTGERWDLFQLYKGDSPGSGGNSIRNMIKGRMFHGGYINQTGFYLTHPGEYVIDADSVRLFSVQFYELINKTETITQRKSVSESLIGILSRYTEDGFPIYDEDWTFVVPSESQVAVMPPQVISIRTGGRSSSSSQEHTVSQDFTYLM